MSSFIGAHYSKDIGTVLKYTATASLTHTLTTSTQNILATSSYADSQPYHSPSPHAFLVLYLTLTLSPKALPQPHLPCHLSPLPYAPSQPHSTATAPSPIRSQPLVLRSLSAPQQYHSPIPHAFLAPCLMLTLSPTAPPQPYLPYALSPKHSSITLSQLLAERSLSPTPLPSLPPSRSLSAP